MPICAKTLAAACLLAASAHGLALLPKFPSASRAPLTRRAYSSTTDYHAEGDESGPAQLSGSWQLETVDEYGTATSATVVLRHDGLFHTAPQPDGEEFTGKWSLSDESELTLARFGRFHSVESYYIGQMRTAQTVDGYVGTGAMDSAWEGTFKMHLIVADERAPVVVEPKLRQYDAAELGGRWRLDSRLFGGVPNFLSLEFDAATREFVVTDGLGEKGHISGNWNVFKDTMRFNEGSGGSGRRFWLTMARFGMLGGETKLKGVQMNQDRWYVGSISDVECTDADGNMYILKRITGYIAEGRIEPDFIGKFDLQHFPEGIDVDAIE